MNMQIQNPNLYRVYHIAPAHITAAEQAHGVAVGKPTTYMTAKMTYDKAVTKCGEMKEANPGLHVWVDVA